MDSKSVCVIGLGFVGLTLATKLAENSRVYGLDTNLDITESINAGTPHFHETGLAPKLSAAVSSGHLSAHTDWRAIPNASIYVVTVGTPISIGQVNLHACEKVMAELKERVRPTDLVIVRSTVKVGSTRAALEQNFPEVEARPLIAMCPERTIEGSAMNELTSLPQIVSGVNEASLQAASHFFEAFGCVTVPVSSLEAAEFAKLLNNTFRDSQFAFANEMAMVAEALGLDAREVIQAANKDYPRSNVPMPGLTGGPCLEKDPWILVESAASVGVEAKITAASREIHESLPRYAGARIRDILETGRFESLISGAVVSVFGLAFKGQPETDDVRGSLATNIVEEVRVSLRPSEVLGVDLKVSNDDATRVGVDRLVTADEAFNVSDVIIVQNNHKQLRDDLVRLASISRDKPLIVLDFWGTFDDVNTGKNIILLNFGNGTT
jgi:UDP-N-acetyl-D-mannosaminuronic acid dehydrogenase